MTGPAPTPQEQQELKAIQDYLHQHAASDFRHMPEKTVSAVLNKASPAVRAHMLKNQQFVEHVINGGRSEPFQPPLTIDPSRVDKATEAIAAKARTEDMTHALLSRMGTDQSAITDTPPTTRDYVEAAFDHHEGSTHD